MCEHQAKAHRTLGVAAVARLLGCATHLRLRPKQRSHKRQRCDAGGSGDDPVRGQWAVVDNFGGDHPVHGRRQQRPRAEERVDAIQVRPGAVAVLLRNQRVGGDADLLSVVQGQSATSRVLLTTPSAPLGRQLRRSSTRR